MPGVWFRFRMSMNGNWPWVHRGQKISGLRCWRSRARLIPGSFIRRTDASTRPRGRSGVRADIPNPVLETEGPEGTPPALRQLYARGRFTGEITAGVMVPSTAILLPGHSAYAYVDNRPRRLPSGRTVKLWPRRQWILGDPGGLDEGEKGGGSGKASCWMRKARSTKAGLNWLGDATENGGVPRLARRLLSSPQGPGGDTGGKT